MRTDNSNNDFEWECVKWLLIVLVVMVCLIPAGIYYKHYRQEKLEREVREQDSIFWRDFYDKNCSVEEDLTEIAKRDSIMRVNDSIIVVRRKEREKKEAEERAAYEKEIRKDVDKFLRSYSRKSSGSNSGSSSSTNHHSNHNEEDDDDDDTWYSDEDDADERDEYDYWE